MIQNTVLEQLFGKCVGTREKGQGSRQGTVRLHGGGFFKMTNTGIGLHQCAPAQCNSPFSSSLRAVLSPLTGETGAKKS